MAEQEKSNYMTIVIVVAVISIAGVMLLKADEVKHLEMAGASTTLESNAAALTAVKRYDNNFTE